jgi:DNA repair protein RecN (Recombination protein N)
VVTDEARVVEIARMLGGDAEREVSRAHARELLARGGEDLDGAPVSALPVEARNGTRAAQRRGKPV